MDVIDWITLAAVTATLASPSGGPVTAAAHVPAPHPAVATGGDGRTPGEACVYVSCPWLTRPRVTVGGDDLTAQIAVYGDSITVQSYPALLPYLSGYRVHLDANVSIPTAAATDRFATYLERRRTAGTGVPPVVLFATGTNDLWFAPGGIRGQVERVRRLVGPSTVLLWVNLFTAPKVPNRYWNPARARWGNEQITAARRPGGGPAVDRVINWYGYLGADPSRPAQMLSDGTHTLPEGGLRRARLVAAALTRMCPTGPDSCSARLS